MAGTTLYFNTQIGGNASASALSCTSLYNSGTFSSIGSATVGALSCSSVFSSGAIVCGSLTSSGSFACDNLNFTNIVCNKVNASGAIVCGSLTSSGALICDNLKFTNILCNNMTASGGTLIVNGTSGTLGQFINPNMTGGNVTSIRVGRGDGGNSTDIMWVNNGGSPYGEINVAAVYPAITYNAGHVVIGGYPTGVTNTFQVNGTAYITGATTVNGLLTVNIPYAGNNDLGMFFNSSLPDNSLDAILLGKGTGWDQSLSINFNKRASNSYGGLSFWGTTKALTWDGSNRVAINSEPNTSYSLYVNGASYINGATFVNGEHLLTFNDFNINGYRILNNAAVSNGQTTYSALKFGGYRDVDPNHVTSRIIGYSINSNSLYTLGEMGFQLCDTWPGSFSERLRLNGAGAQVSGQLFANGTGGDVYLSRDSNYYHATQGCHIGWNQFPGGGGTTAFTNHRGLGGNGGFTFGDWNDAEAPWNHGYNGRRETLYINHMGSATFTQHDTTGQTVLKVLQPNLVVGGGSWSSFGKSLDGEAIAFGWVRDATNPYCAIGASYRYGAISWDNNHHICINTEPGGAPAYNFYVNGTSYFNSTLNCGAFGCTTLATNGTSQFTGNVGINKAPTSNPLDIQGTCNAISFTGLEAVMNRSNALSGQFLNTTMAGGDYAAIRIGNGNSGNSTDIMWKNNSGSPYGEINVAGTHVAITYNTGHVAINSAPSSYSFSANYGSARTSVSTFLGGLITTNHAIQTYQIEWYYYSGQPSITIARTDYPSGTYLCSVSSVGSTVGPPVFALFYLSNSTYNAFAYQIVAAYISISNSTGQLTVTCNHSMAQLVRVCLLMINPQY